MTNKFGENLARECLLALMGVRGKGDLTLEAKKLGFKWDTYRKKMSPTDQMPCDLSAFFGALKEVGEFEVLSVINQAYGYDYPFKRQFVLNDDETTSAHLHHLHHIIGLASKAVAEAEHEHSDGGSAITESEAEVIRAIYHQLLHLIAKGLQVLDSDVKRGKEEILKQQTGA